MNPKLGSPTRSNASWSPPPMSQGETVFIPKSLNGPIHASKIGPTVILRTFKIRGILNVRNMTVGPIFDAWMGPFKDLGMKTVSPWDIGGGDQLAFERVGLPSFGFIQDEIEYDTRTHHSSADVYERIQPEDLQFNTAVLASFAWQAAQRDEKLPR